MSQNNYKKILFSLFFIFVIKTQFSLSNENGLTCEGTEIFPEEQKPDLKYKININKLNKENILFEVLPKEQKSELVFTAKYSFSSIKTMGKVFKICDTVNEVIDTIKILDNQKKISIRRPNDNNQEIIFIELNTMLPYGKEEIVSFRLEKIKANNNTITNNITTEEKYGKLWKIFGTNLINTDSQSKLIYSAITNTKVFKNVNENKLKFELLFSTVNDTFESDVFHKKCDNKNNTLLLVKTKEKIIFGGFTSKKWNMKQGLLMDESAFVFSFYSMKSYPIKKDRYAISTNWGVPLFYSELDYMIFFQKDMKSGQTTTAEKSFFEGITKDYEINGGQKMYNVEQIDVLHVTKEE